MTPWRWEVRAYGRVVAEVTSLEAANAVERLYRNAWAAGLKPESSVSTHVARWQTESGMLDYGNYHSPTVPMTDAERNEFWEAPLRGMNRAWIEAGVQASKDVEADRRHR